MDADKNMHIPAVFSFEDRAVRTVEVEGVTWFVGRDVCDCLGHRNSSDRLGRLDEDERMGVAVADPHGRMQETVVVSEAGVYQLIFTSRVPAAVRFKRWLAHDVLPSLRRCAILATGLPRPVQPGTREFADAIQAVRELRLLAGRDAAMSLWADLGLPASRLAQIERRPKGPDPYEIVVRGFVVEIVVVGGSDERVSATDMWEAFKEWAEARCHDPVSQTAFGLAARGYLRDKRQIGGRWFYVGVSLLDR